MGRRLDVLVQAKGLDETLACVRGYADLGHATCHELRHMRLICLREGSVS